ncbi:UPF0547 protein C16orf87 homolog isoform X2 [Hyla sarda]|uniref:UPF0547 protein C16orf87 homolog isoform X2 n=1 Tax=Hyla sarda TaxID=327740 RepID=UPI0024C2E66B|nr:UPF0547 protein C16orf87 homolog isoform X2 [Hyla sarda]
MPAMPVLRAGRCSDGSVLQWMRVPVACKSCPCGYIFISRKLLHARQTERVPPTSENRSDPKRRRTERIRRERTNSTVNKDLENRRRSRSNSQSDPIRRGRGRPKTAATKKQEEEKAGRSSKESGAEGTTVRYPEDMRTQRGDRGSRKQQWMGEEKQEKEVDMYANLSDEKAFVFSVALAEINRKIINQRLIL